MRLVVLAGGTGERLKSITGDTPKPLVEVEGIPFLKLQIQNWVEQGVKHITFLIGYKSNEFILFFKTNQIKNVKIDYVIENKKLGTGGALINFLNSSAYLFNESFIICNADTWLGNGLKEFNHNASLSSSLLTYGCIFSKNANRYGVIDLDRDGLIEKFTEKFKSDFKVSGLVSAGIIKVKDPILFKKNLRPFMEISSNFEVSFEVDILPSLISQKLVRGVVMESRFIDIGIPEDYNLFKEFYFAD